MDIYIHLLRWKIYREIAIILSCEKEKKVVGTAEIMIYY